MKDNKYDMQCGFFLTKKKTEPISNILSFLLKLGFEFQLDTTYFQRLQIL